MTTFRLAAFTTLVVGLVASAPAAGDTDQPQRQNQHTQNQVKTLHTIEVSADRVNVADSTQVTKDTGAVRVVHRYEFANRITSLAEVLNDVVGVQTRQTGGLGSPSAISIRGSSSKQVQVYLDGMLLNNPATGGVELNLFLLQNIATIKVYPSSPPARFAQAGVGGVVSITTLDITQKEQTRVMLGAGSFGTYKAGVFTSGGAGDFGYWLSFNHQEAENDFEYENPIPTAATRGETLTRHNADFEQDAATGKFGYRLDDNRRVDVLVLWRDSERGVPTVQNFEDNHARLSTETRRIQVHYQDLGAFGGHLHQSHRLAWSQTEEQYLDPTGFIGLGGRDDIRTTSRNLALNSSLSWLQGGHLFSGSVRIARSTQEQDEKRDSQPMLERERVQIALALSHEWTSADGRLSTSAVVRQYFVFNESETTQPDLDIARSSTQNEYFGWSLGGSYQLTSWMELYANVARQIRVPTLRERFGQRGLFVGNPELEAEKAMSYEIGTRWTIDNASLEITGFWRDLDPAIVAVYDARGVGQFTNVAAEVRGIEVVAHYRPFNFWTLNAATTLLDTRNVTPGIADRDDKQLPGVYHENASLSSTWYFGHFRLGVDYHYNNNLYYDSANILAAGKRETIDASLSWQRRWSENRETRVTLEVRNLTDESYQAFNRYPAPGRGFFLNLSQTF